MKGEQSIPNEYMGSHELETLMIRLSNASHWYKMRGNKSTVPLTENRFFLFNIRRLSEYSDDDSGVRTEISWT